MNANIVKPIISISLFVLIITAFYFLIGKDKTELPSQLIDQPVPEFSLRDLNNPEITRTEKDFIGKITMLNVWGSWCPSCYEEHPYWKEYAKNKDVITVGLNYRDKEAKAHKFLREQGDYFEWNIFDEKGRLGIDFGVYGAPETYLIDPKGKIRYRHVGVVSPKIYQEKFLPLIEKIKKGF